MLTAQRLVERSLRSFGDRVAVVDEMRTTTYRTLCERTGRLVNALIALGADRDHPVAVLLPNETICIEVDLAAMRAGVVRVAIGTRLSPDECRYILEHSGARVLITSKAQWERIGGRLLGDLTTVLLVDAKGSDSIFGYEAALERAAPDVTVAEVSSDHPAYILYTSGTTGRPKGALHTHGSRVSALTNMLASEIRADGTSGMVHCAPLSHGSGSKVLTFLALGATNLILPKFDPDILADWIVRRGGSHTFVVPTMLQMMLDAGPQTIARLRTMSQISFGGAPITNALFGRVVDQLGPILTQVYGSCEAPHPITVLGPADYRDLSDPSIMGELAGRPSPGSDASIVADDGGLLGAGLEGELLVRGAHLMAGYWRDAQATAEVFRPGGWYATGDIAVINEQGFVSFRDRKRDLIISGGLNIYPSEVERVLAEHHNVKEVAVVGAPDEKWGETVVACVVLNKGGETTADEISDWVGKHLADYKKPRRVLFMNDLPKGSTNKVLKRELKADLWAGKSRRIN